MKIKKSALFVLSALTIFNVNQLIAQQESTISIDSLSKTVLHLREELNKSKQLNISGYMQPQWQYIDSAGAPSFAGGDFSNGSSKYYSRFMMRRGRVKFKYDYKNVQFVLLPDITEKGIFMRETFIKISDPWLKMFSLTAGMWQDQFGFELIQSSSARETPERARFLQNLFPTERDLGAFITMALPKSSCFYGLKLDAAVMNGSAGVSSEFDSHKDFTGRLSYSKTSKNEKTSFGLGVSSYYGGYRIGNVKDYHCTTLSNGLHGYTLSTDTANYDRVARRIYIGCDIQLSVDSKIGITTIRAEYAQGEQPGTEKSSKSIGAPPVSSIYHRQFNGAYVYLIQSIGKSPFQLVLKYDWYDPNVKLSGKDVGKSGSNTKVADIRYDTYGFGLNYRLNSNVKLMAYYDYVINESTNIVGYAKDIKDNVVTIRLQYKF
jgi:phosphate-selective porin